MRWFKHFTDMHEGRTVSSLMDEMGHMGLCFFLLQELCAEKLDRPDKSGESLTEADCLFTFPARNVRQKLRISQTNLRRLLDICQTNGQLSFNFCGENLEIKMPILLDLLDSDSRKARTRRVRDASRSRLDIDIDRDKEKIEIKKLAKTSNESDKSLNRDIWDAYSQAFFDRYKTDPVRNASVNGKISQIGKRLGADSVDVVKFFISHNDSFYLKQVHAIGLCLKDAESLHAQWKRNKPITAADVRYFERQGEYDAQMKRLATKDGIK